MLKETIYKDLKEAMKAKEALKLEVLRMIKAEIIKYEVSGADKVIDDEMVITILKRGVKQRKESAEGFEKGGNAEAAQKELDEIKILKTYLPELMSEDEVREIIQGVITQTSTSDLSDFGKVMGIVMGKTKGKADGNIVNQLVKEMLSSN